jgi:hypothetical protein
MRAESIRSGAPWPEAISSGLTLPCHDCGRVPALDYNVSDGQWRRTVPAPAPARLGVVCLECFIARLSADEPLGLERIQVVHARRTVELVPARVYDWRGYWHGDAS